MWNFSLARRAQLPKTLWKYPSHPLFDSANRGGGACIFITPAHRASNEPRACSILREQIECSVRHMLRLRYNSQHTDGVHNVFTAQCMARAKLGCMPSLAPCQRAVNAYVHYSDDTQAGCIQLRVNKFAMDCVKTLCAAQQLYNDVTIKQR